MGEYNSNSSMNYTTGEDTVHPHIVHPVRHFAEYGVFVFAFFGVLGNALVLYCFLSNRALRRRMRNMLVIHQGIVDFSSSVWFFFCYGSKAVDKDFSGMSGHVLCALLDSEAVLWILLCVSTANLVLITFERYCLVVKPVFYRNNVTKFHILCSIIAIWFLTVSLQGIVFFYTSGVVDFECQVVGLWPSRELEKSFCIFYVLMNYCLPLGVFVGCYVHMLHELKERQRVLVTCHLDLKNTESAVIDVNYRRTTRLTETQNNLTKTMFIISICFIICWTPSHVHYIVTTFRLAEGFCFHGRLYRIVTYAAVSNVCVNPIIYGFKYEDFRNEAKRIMFNRKKKLQPTVQIFSS